MADEVVIPINEALVEKARTLLNALATDHKEYELVSFLSLTVAMYMTAYCADEHRAVFLRDFIANTAHMAQGMKAVFKDERSPAAVH